VKEPVHIVHITPHLGGGVGKALSTLVAAQKGSGFAHTFLLLEQPRKKQFLDALAGLGARIEFLSRDNLVWELLSAADIVQLEWWNHPATFEFLCRNELPPMRLLVWSHVSGLHTPIIPRGLLEAAHRFVFTSPCSFQAPVVAGLDEKCRARLGVVSSGVGLAAPRPRRLRSDNLLRAGYIGSLNFSKLHPNYVKYLAAVDMPNFKVTIWGDPQNRDVLLEQCCQAGKPEMMEFAGYTTDVADELAALDIFVYLLNPYHYGTAENALLEAMSAGVVPIVLANPAERVIVRNGETGYVVDTVLSFAETIQYLYENPAERVRIGTNAARWVAARFAPENMGQGMGEEYSRIGSAAKRRVEFQKIFGRNPSDWFLSFQGIDENYSMRILRQCHDIFLQHNVLEPSKGSLSHFCNKFPNDTQLMCWKKMAEQER